MGKSEPGRKPGELAPLEAVVSRLVGETVAGPSRCPSHLLFQVYLSHISKITVSLSFQAHLVSKTQMMFAQVEAEKVCSGNYKG